MRPAFLLAVFAIGASMLADAHANDGFGYLAGAAWRPAADEVVIDSRPLADCKKATLPNARCLPADGFLGPYRSLPSERDTLWLLGTAGLDGSETVLVVGQDATARDFVAGLLYLSGQRQVRVLTEPLARVLAGRSDAAPGQERGIIRTAVFVAPMRGERLVLKQELLREGAGVTLIDGRSELEYWGEAVRAARGGHLPGAVLLPAATLAVAGPRPVLPSGMVIAYGHDAYEGLAYFTRLAAGLGMPAHVYAGGWAEWAADGSLPVDNATYPERRTETLVAVPPAPTPGASRTVLMLAAAVALVVAFAGGWYLSKKQVA
ncbi:MAG: hypothetical protein M0P95_18250 [Sulfuritalea sp.]|jgi:thiosulfate/3-mercaptopyruvate sulfurtransferase|nr:hypothetical protein [Sulfuritalea sp.]